MTTMMAGQLISTAPLSAARLKKSGTLGLHLFVCDSFSTARKLRKTHPPEFTPQNSCIVLSRGSVLCTWSHENQGRIQDFGQGGSVDFERAGSWAQNSLKIRGFLLKLTENCMILKKSWGQMWQCALCSHEHAYTCRKQSNRVELLEAPQNTAATENTLRYVAELCVAVTK